VSEFRGKFEVLLDLFEALSRLDHLGHLIPHHNKVALLLLQVALDLLPSTSSARLILSDWSDGSGA
jgi:hypothetical protein